MNNDSIKKRILDGTPRDITQSNDAQRERAVIREILEDRAGSDACTASFGPVPRSEDCTSEHGGETYALNVMRTACRSNNFRESIWSGDHLQMTVMSIDRRGEIGAEMHGDTDQYIRVEHGCAKVLIGSSESEMTQAYRLSVGDAIFVPACTWHNVINTGRGVLKLSSVYAPPHHPRCTVQKNK